jgi:hypothetical protein
MILSVISESELLVKPLREDDVEAVGRIGALLAEDAIEVVDVDRGIARLAARLRASHKALRLPDATIIATGLQMHCDLILGNDALWSRVPDVPYVRLDDIVST